MEPEIESFKTKDHDLCIKCDKELKTKSFGADSFLGIPSAGTGAFYCANKECDFFGVLTLARTKKTEKITETTK